MNIPLAQWFEANSSKWFARAELLLWPHILVPLGIMILIDYLQVFSKFIQYGLLMYMCIQVCGIMIGFWAGAMTTLDPRGNWVQLLRHKNLLRVLPLIKIGFEAAKWSLKKEQEGE